MSQALQNISFFSQTGRRVVSRPYRVFNVEELTYYFIQNNSFDLGDILLNFHEAGIGENINLSKFRDTLDLVARRFSGSSAFGNLFRGVHVPFIVPALDRAKTDVSFNTVQRFLPKLERSFKKRYADSHFKAIVQGASELDGNLVIDDRSRYNELFDEASQSDLIGWYFPQALQQFDTDSQVRQIDELPSERGVCVSGPMEILAANIGKPDLLINENGYAPILTMPSVRHIDEKLILALKSYGPHLEFWCLSNELSRNLKQVSEQWSGGISLYVACG